MNNGQPPKNRRTRADKVVHLNAFKDVDSASDQAIEWLARIRSEDLQEGELGAFAEWLAASSQHQQAFDDATALWHVSGAALDQLPEEIRILEATSNGQLAAGQQLAAGKQINAGDSAKGIGKAMSSQDSVVQPTYRPWHALGVAATFVLACIVMLVQMQAPQFHTGKGEQRRIVLEDGSTVFLNTATRIEVDYTGQQRRIRLIQGEAWFDVRKDAKRPFVVEGDFATATAIGTSFTVRDTDEFTKVAVTEGQVQVHLENSVVFLTVESCIPDIQAGHQAQLLLLVNGKNQW